MSALDEVERHVRRFVAYPSEHAAVAHVLWIAHTHLVAEFDNTPRLAALSPEPGSGKTRLLEVTEPLVPRPVLTVNASPAYVFRKIGATPEEGPPTLLMDEVDAIFAKRGSGDSNEELRGLLNSGYRRGATTGRAAPRGREIVTEEWPSFAPVALAGLGDLPDTLMTRSIVIRMQRRRTDEPIEPYRERVERSTNQRLATALAKWAASVLDTVRANPWPALPVGIVDRDADVWEPLMAVADAAGGMWPARARAAAITMVEEAHKRPATIGLRLLTDIRAVLGARDRITTAELIDGLGAIEAAPWAALGGTGIDANYLAKQLRKYGVRSTKIRVGNSTLQGYLLRGDDDGSLWDAFARYCPPAPEHPEHPQQPTADVPDVPDVLWMGGACGVCQDPDHDTLSHPPVGTAGTQRSINQR